MVILRAVPPVTPEQPYPEVELSDAAKALAPDTLAPATRRGYKTQLEQLDKHLAGRPLNDHNLGDRILAR